MIPIYLTLQGLYSYRKKQSIDFSKLTQAGLFGIFGSVGCGKSTILEAISFALFGESERLNARDNRNYNMMNLKSNELLIDFEFKTGGEQRYRFMVKGKRNSKRFDDVKAFDRSAYKFENEAWQPIEVSLAESITGLNYNNFHRTIIIPQGKFQEFLQLSAKDRTTMLQELFSLNKFELSGRVIGLENNNNALLQNLRGQLQSIGEINPDDIAAKEKMQGEMQQNLLRMDEVLLVKQKAEQEYERIKKLHQKLQEQKLHLAELQKDQPEIGRLEQEIKEFENFIIVFKSDFDRLKMLEGSRIKTTGELNIAQKQLDNLLEKITKTETEFIQIKIGYEQKDKLLQESEELLKLVEIRKLQFQNEELSKRSQKGKAIVDERVLSIGKYRQELVDLNENVENKRKELPDMEQLAAVKEWFANQKHIKAAVAESQIKLESLTKEAGNKKQELVHLPIMFGFSFEQGDVSSLTAIRAAVERMKSQAETDKHKMEDEILHLEIRDKLNAFSSSLENGKPCPLCGSEHHPNVLDAQNVSQELSLAKARLMALSERMKKIANLETEFVKLATQLTSLESQLATESNRSKELVVSHLEHEAKFVWPGFVSDNEALVTSAFEKASLLTKAIEQLTQKQNEISAKIETGEKEKENYAKALEVIERQIVSNNSQLTLLNGQLNLIKAEDHQSETLELIIAGAEKLSKQCEEVVRRYHQEEKQLAEMRNQFSVLSGGIETNQRVLKSLEEDVEKLAGQITEKLCSSGNLERGYVESVLEKKLDTSVVKKKIETFHHELQLTVQLLSQTESELQGKIYDEKLHEEVKELVASLSLQKNTLNQEVGKIRTEIQRLKADLERYAGLKAEVDKLELRGQDISEMKNLFRGNAFVNFISTVYLENLCKAANDRFYKLTRQKLSLELATDNSFEVRDFMNEGKLRNVKTLSGGQTFQASLSLALALADSIQKISAGHENFFFLDEGFGTLDKDSLNIVFDTLKSLRRENRIVGVISHVEEMQQEIETYLKVINEEEAGSMIKASWE